METLERLELNRLCFVLFGFNGLPNTELQEGIAKIKESAIISYNGEEYELIEIPERIEAGLTIRDFMR